MDMNHVAATLNKLLEITKDGESGLMCVGDGETYVIPIEVAETRYGIIVDRYELDTRTDAGAGLRTERAGLHAV